MKVYVIIFVLFMSIMYLMISNFSTYGLAETTNDKKELSLIKVNPSKPNYSNVLKDFPANFSESFEAGKIDWKIWDKEFGKKTYSCKLTNKLSSDGKYSIRMELRKSDSEVFGSKRAEISLKPERALEEHWYSISVYLPNSKEEDYAKDKSEEIIMQWHNTPDPGEEWTSPPLALATKNGRYLIERFWDENPKITSVIAGRNEETYDIGSYFKDKGKWVSWDFHVKWGWLVSQDPILEVYKNGTKVLDCSGLPNTTNDIVGNSWKIGLYKWEWKTKPYISNIDKRVIYYDNIMIR